MNTKGNVSERLRQLDEASRSGNNTIAQPALRILGHVAQSHLIALAVALEEQRAAVGQLREYGQRRIGIDHVRTNPLSAMSWSMALTSAPISLRGAS